MEYKSRNSDKFKFFDFVRTYHERDNPHCPPLPIQYNKPLVAVLDGQQRMTALNIGLRGSYAEKVKWKWWSSPDAFPTKRMYLNLLSEANFETDDKFEFVFREDGLSEHEAKSLWFPVGEILGLSGGPDMQDWIEKFELQKEQRKTAYRTLDMLYRVIHTDQLISYYEEKNQYIERVLSIFIRINSGGTKLSYSDLLLSVAVAQWQTLDARDEIHKVVDEMNSNGSRFNFSKDLVLKAGLMLADIGNVGFKVANFTHENMTTLEAKWKGIRKALVLATHLLSSFGFNGQVLRADSALLPIAYYLYIRKFGDSYLTDNKYVDDRHEIRQWLVKTLLKSSGIWGSGLDTFLGRLRDVINNHGDSGFPINEIVSEMNKSGKSLTFEQEEMEDLLDVQYGQPLTFSVLSLLFPHLDLSHHFHIDHVYPKSKLVKRELEALGFSVAEIDLFGEMANKLPNLQLLQGAINVQKQAQSPAQWADDAFTGAQRPAYVSTNMLGTLPRDPKGFEDFFTARRNLLQQRLSSLLA